jgi:hypothetical protein
VEKDSYRKRFDTSDAIILPMVQKGKVEETMLESIPQLAIQLVNTWMLGQLYSMPALTIFSVSLSVISLTNTLWYYAYWNLFRCMPIRDVPSTLALYNYKLSGVTDGAFSFAKASSEVVEIELSEIENMMSVTISGTVLNEVYSGDEQLGQLPPKNEMQHSSAAGLANMTGAGILNAQVDASKCAGDSMSGIAKNDAEVSRLRQELQDKEAAIEKLWAIQEEKEAENKKLREFQELTEAEIKKLREFQEAKDAENEKLSAIRKEKEAEILKLQESNRHMEAMMKRLRLELQRLPNVAVGANAALHITHNAAAGDVIGGIVDDDHSSNSPRITRAAITLQSVTRGHLGRRLIPARRSEVDANKNEKEKSQDFAQILRGNGLHYKLGAVVAGPITQGSKSIAESEENAVRLFHCTSATGKFETEEVPNFSQQSLFDEANGVMLLDTGSNLYIWNGPKPNPDANDAERQNDKALARQYCVETGRPNMPVHSVVGGNEPHAFTSCFTGWNTKVGYEVAAAVAQNASKPPAATAAAAPASPVPAAAAPVQGLPTSTKFSLEALQARAADTAGCDSARLHEYLSDADFQKAFGMSLAVFDQMPGWKQDDAKKKHRLF